MDQAGNRAMGFFAERIRRLAGGYEIFSANRYHGTAKRLSRVVWVDQAGIIRCDGQRQRAPGVAARLLARRLTG